MAHTSSAGSLFTCTASTYNGCSSARQSCSQSRPYRPVAMDCLPLIIVWSDRMNDCHHLLVKRASVSLLSNSMCRDCEGVVTSPASVLVLGRYGGTRSTPL